MWEENKNEDMWVSKMQKFTEEMDLNAWETVRKLLGFSQIRQRHM